MDIREFQQWQGQARHPWEEARADALIRILHHHHVDPHIDILDVGCGDGYSGHRIADSLHAATWTGVDPHAIDIATMQPTHTRHTWVKSPDALVAGHRFDLLLLLDVLEHIDDDLALLVSYCRHRMKSGGWVLITVPAFQMLFSTHDRALGHVRRYHRTQLQQLVTQGGVTIVDQGYLFSSLLLPRLLQRAIQSLPGRKTTSTTARPLGLANWRGGQLLNQSLRRWFFIDNQLLFQLSQRHLFVPGLSLWLLGRIAKN